MPEGLQHSYTVPAGRKSHSLAESIRAGYVDRPYKAMIVGSYESVTYSEAFYRTISFAHVLREAGISGKESTVLFSSNNCAWYPIVIAAVQLCGARMVLAAGGAEAADFADLFTCTKPDAAIVSSTEHVDAVRAISEDMPVFSLRCTAFGATSLEEAVATARSQGHFMIDSVEADPEIVLFSSGSTGKPKAIVNRSSSFQRSGFAQAQVLQATDEDVCYIPVPFSHTYGMVSLYTAMEMGCTIATNAKYRPDVSLAAIASSQATLYFGVPTMYVRELSLHSDVGWDISSLHAGLVAGSTCPAAVFSEYQDRYGCTLVQCYGMTETAATLTAGSLADSAEVRAHCVGKPIEGAQLKFLPETGEICCKTPSFMSGILQSDGSLDLQLDEEGWFHTGDVGELDSEGRLSITGRIKDLIIRGGINIFPAEVENIYQENESIETSCLVGYPDPELGERSCLCVVLKETDNEPSAFELRSFAKGRIEKCKIPDVVLKMDDLPRLGNGKIDKKTLKAQVLELHQNGTVRRG